MAGKLRVTLVKSPVSHTRQTRATVRALGLHRMGETIEVVDNAQVRGMTNAVRFLLRTEEMPEPEPAARPKKEESKS
jgi:large subunit ribosomal protein L30